jgi:hypothetical protein
VPQRSAGHSFMGNPPPRLLTSETLDSVAHCVQFRPPAVGSPCLMKDDQ